MINRVTIAESVCKGCALCVSACPKQIMMMNREKLGSKGYYPATLTDTTQCTACAVCATICPDSAITVEKE